MSSPNEPKSVSMIIKQRQQSRSATVAPKPGGKTCNSPGGSGTVNENLNPVLPPLFPPAPKPTTLDLEVANSVKVYNKLTQYFKSNFSVELPNKNLSGFYVNRYTDQYKSPLALKPHLLHTLPDSWYPEELTRKSAIRKPLGTKKVKRKLEDIPDAEDGEKPVVKPKVEEDEENEEEEKEETNLDDFEENDDDVDEEMDVGTDYALSYFDNGEADDDDREEDDGPTY